MGAPTLSDLHWNHLLQVPFENLDIPLGYPIELSLNAVFKKIVSRRRGGFCYELNYAFSLLLNALGFDLSLLSAQVFNDGVYGPPFDHMLLLVRLGKDRWIADVGFGDSFRQPLPLDSGVVKQGGVQYQIEKRNDEQHILSQKKGKEGWIPQFIFTLEDHPFEAFRSMCRYHQTSPESSFTQKSVCSIATQEGRVTFSNGRWITSFEDNREEKQIRDPFELRSLLRLHHGVELPKSALVERLLK